MLSNNVDYIVFSLYDKAYNHCGDEPLGTYITPVPRFVQGWVSQQAQDSQDQGIEYQKPAVAQFAYCTEYAIQNQMYYFQFGCADDSNTALAINIYEDNKCTKRSLTNGYDDSNLDVSAIQINFRKCKNCVQWFDMDADVDDKYFESKKTSAPLCSASWAYKQNCDRKCRRSGLEMTETGWTPSDQVLLAILIVFAITMLTLIVRKRQKMSNKDALLEQAAMSAAGLQQPHVIGVCILVILVIAVFALLGLKNITWGLLLVVNSSLFIYMMKLTVDTSRDAMIGPDGNIVRSDSDESSVDDSARDPSAQPTSGLFTLPALT